MNWNLVTTFLAGMLLASFGYILHLNGQLERLQTEAEGMETEQAEVEAEVPTLDLATLGLSAEQEAALANCGGHCNCRMKKMREEVRSATVALQEACSAPDLDMEQVQAAAEELCRLRDQEVQDHVSSVVAVREVLNPGQVQKLRQEGCRMDSESAPCEAPK